MRILFIENRAKTFCWEVIAEDLQKLGHSIYWIIQNKSYRPEMGEKYIINYPKKEFHGLKDDSDGIQRIIEADRQINFFGLKSRDHFYYYNQVISDLLDKIKPEIVFGESTAFHELLVIENCKAKNILYLNPSSCRYPPGRFSFYKYDTLIPFLGSDEKLSTFQAEKFIKKIAKREVSPDYMKVKKYSRREVMKDRIFKIRSFYKGERYNTPSPFIKFKIEMARKSNIKVWDKVAFSNIIDKAKFSILYPLQMQPEANIDVWGYEHRNQLETIKELVKVTDDDTIIYIKPNPKSKYELSKELLSFVQTHPRLIPMKHSVNMADVFDDIDLIITVTGTVAIEAILTDKPVVTLIKTINNYNKSCIFLETLPKLPIIIEKVKQNSFPITTYQEKIDFINYLNKTSFKGIISKLVSSKHAINNDNIKNAFLKILCYHSL